VCARAYEACRTYSELTDAELWGDHPVIYGEGRAVIKRAPDEILDFVMDLHRYRHADVKIRKVASVERTGDEATVKFRSRLRGLPTPTVTQLVTLTPGKRIDIRSAPNWMERMVEFEGFVTCEEGDEGTEVVHRETFRFKGPVGFLMERYLKSWIAQDLVDEVNRMKEILEDGREGDLT
jgi:Polyketide cyclase / dehydrase and lipid transport